MSSFMKYLSEFNLNTEEEEEIVETVVAPKPVVKKPQAKPVSVDASVKMIENRIKTALDDVGLNVKTINEVLQYVLGGVSKVSNVNVQQQQPQQRQQEPVRRESYSCADLASDILMGESTRSYGDSLMNNSQPQYQQQQPQYQQPVSMGAGCADHAASLL